MVQPRWLGERPRRCQHIVAEGRRSGKFTPGKILLDATSGNTGIAYAMLGAAEGFPVTLCMPQNVSLERKKILPPTARTLFIPIPAMDPTARSAWRANLPQDILIYISTPISTPTTPTGWPTITARPMKSGSRPKDASLISSPCSAPAALSWAPRAV
jgi:hypothetical protein